MDAGKVYVRDGFLQASEDALKITVTGFGTHCAEPHTGMDPILAASHIMIALQSIVSRNANPLKELVVSIGSFRSGHADNVIPNEAKMEGTIRVFNPELRNSPVAGFVTCRIAPAHTFLLALKWTTNSMYSLIITENFIPMNWQWK
ncbi:peptidase dimerization domain-containing protein [Sporosarcina sp. G11-34]|uniref:peptidase dimerization domain-containing protein n=1 Tax=Sporosarcina sp. G11-34 TaxID=2849605 RepID=UPI0022A9A99F|nr:peptidase dimerization domain-containing protein [Sporosarcina sp. G11-34]